MLAGFREMRRRQFLGAVALAGGAGVAPSTARTSQPADFDIVRVPDDEPTVQEGVDGAATGDVVLVESGTYEEAVEVSTPDITVRGTDRNEVVLDGGFERRYGLEVVADGVAVENLTARNYAGTPFYWTGVEGFRGSYLTAHNNGGYGIYAYRSRKGRFEYSYASGNRDAGFYFGRNDSFEAVIADVVAEYNGLGYSGTSAGDDLTIRDSTWRHNQAGIVPNTLDRSDPPQHSSRIVGNEVHDDDNPDAPNKPLMYPAFGTGILVWGGRDNRIEDNEVRGHENFGIAAEPNVVEPSGNVVRGNTVAESGRADLALGEPAGRDNRFEGNEFSTSLPPDVEASVEGGDSRVSEVFAEQERRAEGGESGEGDGSLWGDWREQPVPGDRPTMPDPEAPPLPADESTSRGEEAEGR